MKNLYNLLLDKGWVHFILSFISTFIVIIFIPDEFYDCLPFNNSVNVVLVFSIILCAFFLVYYGITQLYKKIKNKNAKRNFEDEKLKVESSSIREKLWNEVDKLSPNDRKYLLEFIKNGNQPIELSGNICYDYCSLFSSDWVISTEISSDENNGVQSLIYQSFNRKRLYKLNDKIYTLLKYFYDETGQISNFG